MNNYQKRKIYLSFFRDIYCPFCNIRLNKLIKEHKDFEKNSIKVIVFFGSTQDQILEYASEQKAPFPIIPDPDLIIYKKYGVEISLKAKLRTMQNYNEVIKAIKSEHFNLKSFTERDIVPADFLIGENLIIEKAYYGRDFGNHIPVQEILKWK